MSALSRVVIAVGLVGMLVGCSSSLDDEPRSANEATPVPTTPEFTPDELRNPYVSDDPAVIGQRFAEGRALFEYVADTRIGAREEEPPTQIADLGITRLEISYASPLGGRVPATMLIPEDSRPLPTVIFQHGLPGTRLDTLGVAEVFARAGVITMSIDAPFARREDGQESPVTFTDRDRREQIQLIVDLRRAVDLLVDRPEVDSARIGYYGVSYGAAMGALLAGTEKRISTYMLAVGDGGLVEHFTGVDDASGPLGQLSDSRQQRWIAAMEPIEPLYFVGQAAPGALYLQSALEDSLVPPLDAVRLQQAAGDPKVEWYDADHGLNLEARCDAARWLSTRLNFPFVTFDACV